MTDKNLIPITIARGDGIGPEIMDAALSVLKAAGAPLKIEEIEIGEKAYKAGYKTGMAPHALDSLKRTRVFLKAPVTTPLGGGYKSLNVTVRKAFGLYANVRPCVSYFPFVKTKHPKLDIVIVRENEEDLYAGIEYRQTTDSVQSLKLMTRPGCERIIYYAFEYARRNGRKKVTCFTKDNIMKQTDGLFHKCFLDIGEKYPDIEQQHLLIDIGTALLADRPETFDVIVVPNLYGDIISDVAAQIAGSVGLAGSANIGSGCAMFEAAHGSAPTLAGQDVANPSGLLLATVQMLVHIGQYDVATKIHNAWLCTIEDGVHTADYTGDAVKGEPVGTREFARCVVARLGKTPKVLKGVTYKQTSVSEFGYEYVRPVQQKTLVGVDVYIDDVSISAAELAVRLQPLCPSGLKLSVIENRGIRFWPDGYEGVLQSDLWRCRFILAEDSKPVTHAQITALLQAFAETQVDFVKTENLCCFDGIPAYSATLG